MLEQIIKRFVPFTGTYTGEGFDEKGRIVMPEPLIERLKERQGINEKNKLRLFYRLHAREVPNYIELRYYPGEPSWNIALYREIQIDEQSYICIPNGDLKKIGIEKSVPIAFFGYNNKIFIYTAENYEDYVNTFNVLDSLWNAFIRLYERFSLPEVR